MSQRQQLERFMFIDAQIRAGIYPNAERIAEKLEVSKRVIYQDKAFMAARLGAPIEFHRQYGGWYYTNPTWALPSMFVSEGELMAFFLSMEVAQRYLGTDFEEPLRSAVTRLSSNLGNHIQIDLENLRENYTFAAPAAPSVKPELLASMNQAIQKQLQVRIRYYTASRGEWNERTINPHHLYNNRGDWYLFAFDQNRQEMRSFHLGRVDWWKILKEEFERVPNFSAQEWMKGAFQVERGGEPVDVAIRFDSFQAPWIRERRWHESQQPLEELEDGSVILRFRSGGLGEVLRWALQFGSHAEILEPVSLRKIVRNEIKLMAEAYSIGKQDA